MGSVPAGDSCHLCCQPLQLGTQSLAGSVWGAPCACVVPGRRASLTRRWVVAFPLHGAGIGDIRAMPQGLTRLHPWLQLGTTGQRWGPCPSLGVLLMGRGARIPPAPPRELGPGSAGDESPLAQGAAPALLPHFGQRVPGWRDKGQTPGGGGAQGRVPANRARCPAEAEL